MDIDTLASSPTTTNDRWARYAPQSLLLALVLCPAAAAHSLNMPKSHRNRLGLGPQHRDLRRQVRRQADVLDADADERLGRGLVGTVAGLPVVTNVATALKGGGGATSGTATRTGASPPTTTTVAATTIAKAGSHTSGASEETEGASPTTGSESDSTSGPNGSGDDVSTSSTRSAATQASGDEPSSNAAASALTTGTTSTASSARGSTAFVVLGSSTVPVLGSGPTSTGRGTGPGPSAASTSSSTNGTTTSDSENTSKSTHSTHSGGFAALGVLLALSLCALIILYARRRANRAGQRTWWAATLTRRRNRSRSLSEKSTGTGTSDLRVSATDDATIDTKSIRSSFGTSFDHSMTWLADNDNPRARAAPELPPMAQIRDGPTGRLSLRLSPSESSAGNAYASPALSPISVDSTFSLVSTIAFAGASSSPIPTGPRPPLVDVGTDSSLSLSAYGGADRRTSAASSVYSTTSFEVSAVTAAAGTGTGGSVKPFSDTFASETSETQTVYRPFDSTRPDELSVRAGDQVRVLEVYDDGWAMVEMLPVPVSGAEQQKQGLIPVDCLRADEGVQVYLQGPGKKVSGDGDGSTRTRTRTIA